LLLENRRRDGVRQSGHALSAHAERLGVAAPLRVDDQQPAINADGENFVPDSREAFVSIVKDPLLTDGELPPIVVARCFARHLVREKIRRLPVRHRGHGLQTFPPV
jgi:hypothetical protein